MDTTFKPIKLGADRERPDRQKLGKAKTNHGNSRFFAKGGDTMATKKLPPFMGKESAAEEKAEKKSGKVPKFAKGGFVGKADGVAQRGKTKATQIKMAGGGKVCK